jgi:hypothetical protein
MWDIWRFIIAAGYLGGGSVVLAIVLLVVSYIEHKRDKNVRATVLFVISCLAFCFGAYSAWHDADAALAEKTAENTQLSKRIEDLARPDFHVSLREVTVGSDTPDDTRVIFFMGITNTGAPSIAPYKDATLTLADGRVIQGIRVLTPKSDNSLPVPGMSKGVVEPLLVADYLPIKAIKEPIPRGGEVNGWVDVQFPISSKVADVAGTVLTIRVRDVNEKIYTVSGPIFTEKPKPWVYDPGNPN